MTESGPVDALGTPIEVGSTVYSVLGMHKGEWGVVTSLYPYVLGDRWEFVRVRFGEENQNKRVKNLMVSIDIGL